MTRCTLLVDKVARRFCAAEWVASLPMPAVRTTNGLSAKSRRDAACSIEAFPWTNSSIVLRKLLTVSRLARTSSRYRGGRLPKAKLLYRRPRPSRAEVETSAETRPMRLYESPSLVEAAEGVARQHVGSWNVSALEQRVEVGRYLRAVLGGVSGLAPPATCTVVDADTGVTGYGRRNPPHIRGHLARARLKHHCGTA